MVSRPTATPQSAPEATGTQGTQRAQRKEVRAQESEVSKAEGGRIVAARFFPDL
jgi:hypothetical protein